MRGSIREGIRVRDTVLRRGRAIGFRDPYGFDCKALGVRAYLSEAQTRGVSAAGAFAGASAYEITYP